MKNYRTKTYIAGDWTGDKDFIDQLYKWNKSNHWGLHFLDAHELTQARDTSKPCSIKKSLSARLNKSKTFVLIVGEKTASLTKGDCRYCDDYDAIHSCCKSCGIFSVAFIVMQQRQKDKNANILSILFSIVCTDLISDILDYS